MNEYSKIAHGTVHSVPFTLKIMATAVAAFLSIAAYASVASAHHAPPPAPQRFANCKPVFQVQRKNYKKAEARNAARNAWRDGVRRRYGSRFTDWQYAAHNKTKCKRINLIVKRPGESRPDRYTCSARAYPCAPW